MKQVSVCNFCGSDKTEIVYTLKERILKKEYFQMVKCKQCELIFTNPQPTKDEMKNYYPENYYSFSPFIPNPFLPYSKNIFKKITTFIKKSVLVENYNYSFQDYPSSLFIRPLQKLLGRIFKYQIGWIFPPFILGGVALDVGCGSGIYLTKLHELGWKTYGIDPHAGSIVEWAKEKLDLTIFAGELTEAHFPNNYFNIVTFFHTFEHLHEPLKILSEVYRILKPGGILIINVPNVGSLERSIFKNHWIGWDPPRHLFHFFPDTIKKILIKTKFSITKIGYPSDPRSVISSIPFLYDTISNEKYAWKWVRNCLDADKNTLLRIFLIPIAFFLSLTRQTGELVIFAKK